MQAPKATNKRRTAKGEAHLDADQMGLVDFGNKRAADSHLQIEPPNVAGRARWRGYDVAAAWTEDAMPFNMAWRLAPCSTVHHHACL